MVFFKVIINLLLLISCSSTFAFSLPLKVNDLVQESNIVAAEIEESSPFIFEGTLSFSSGIVKFIPSDDQASAYQFISSYKGWLASKYVIFSRTLDSALGIQEIIFPFHSFL
ncbi:hypothetical protein SAMN03097699_1727 [Flavobacteriaceae bacterium MAR_2010_188]|nr:hypothetical protein SAMN03097699_1727 [Flavobacteriaceae bacterium MAR_2010_188]